MIKLKVKAILEIQIVYNKDKKEGKILYDNNSEGESDNLLLSGEDNLNLLFESLNINENEDKIDVDKDNQVNNYYKISLKERINRKIDNSKIPVKAKKKKIYIPKR